MSIVEALSKENTQDWNNVRLSFFVTKMFTFSFVPVTQNFTVEIAQKKFRYFEIFKCKVNYIHIGRDCELYQLAALDLVH